MLTWAISFAIAYGSADDAFLALSVIGDVIIMLMVCAAWNNTRSEK
jgi:hypothetical protein